MPIPGPRDQFGPSNPNYKNPQHEEPDRVNRWLAPLPIAVLGESPGLMVLDRRGMTLGAGQVRKNWRQAINEVIPAEPYDRVTMSPAPGRPAGRPRPAIGLTQALRYMSRSLYVGSGNDNSRFENMHTVITHRSRGMPVTLGAGTVQNRPTVRNRMTSFGSRVPVLNPRVPAAEVLSGE